MPRLEVNGTAFNVAQIDCLSDGPARDLVLCHGLASSSGFWPIEMLMELRQSYRVTLFDLRGHGRSRMPAEGYTAAALGADIAGVISRLGLERPRVMAHSFGGVAALSMLAADPGNVDSLVLLDSQIGAGRRAAVAAGDALDAALVAALGRAGIEVDPADPFAGVHLLTRLAERRAAEQDILSDDPRVQHLAHSVPPSAARRWLKLVTETTALTDLTQCDGLMAQRLANLDRPVLALCGDNSAAVHTGSFVARTLPGGRFETLPQAGHFFVRSRPQEVVARCTAFWDAVDAPVVAPRRAAC